MLFGKQFQTLNAGCPNRQLIWRKSWAKFLKSIGLYFLKHNAILNDIKGEMPVKEYQTEKAIVRIHGEPNREVLKKACKNYASKVLLKKEGKSYEKI